MASKLEAYAKKHKIKYFLINFTDLIGAQRSKLVPTPAIEHHLHIHKSHDASVHYHDTLRYSVSSLPIKQFITDI